MEERLKELKEKITSFAKDYNIKDFSIYINSRTEKIRNEEEIYKVDSIDIQLEV